MSIVPPQLRVRTTRRARIRFTELGLGGGALGGWYSPIPRETAVRTVLAAHEQGIRYFDTAPLYGHGRSEERAGAALERCVRSGLTIGTKVGIMIEPHSGTEAETRYAAPFVLDGRYDFGYDACMQSIESSLARLRTDYVDIAYVHDPDEADSARRAHERRGVDHFDEVLNGAYRALLRLRDQGVVRAIGIGMNGSDLLMRFADAADFDCFLIAGRYTLLEQRCLDDFLPMCHERGIGVVVGGVFNSGILAIGARKEPAAYNYASAPQAVVDRVRRIEDACDEFRVELAAAALQFPLGHPAVVSVIPGARSPAEVTRNVSSIGRPIPADFWEALKARGLLRPDAPVPSDWADLHAPAGKDAAG